jgi:hypothetical protein
VDVPHTKPKLVFFAYRYRKDLPEFLLIHKREHVKCLSEFFEVTVVDYDCDYQQVCDQYHPDVTLFESARNVSFAYCRKPRITNVRACSQIPKLGFLYADSFSEGRAGFFSDMDHWGIDTFFSNAITAAEHIPEISNHLFTWPNFADSETYRDYGLWKNIPVLFTGNTNSLYPWRTRILELVSRHYPSLVCPHPGFAPQRAMTYAVSGEAYARLLNASWFVPACGSVAKEAVRKHFEIPASKACLITEASPALEAAGFVDMASCVFADPADILDKLEYLFRNRDALDRIIRGGHQLVHSRHTLKHRDQIFQWWSLHKNLKSNEAIVQCGPFERLQIVDTSLKMESSHVASNGLHLMLLRQGDAELWNTNYSNAERLYLRTLNYVPWMPEPQFRLALCSLYKGDARAALSWIVKPIQLTLLDYGAVDPDPVEWAYFIITLLCLGKLDKAADRARQFAGLSHRELDRVRWITNALKGRKSGTLLPHHERVHSRVSIHQLPDHSLREWIRQLSQMLSACGQSDLANGVTACLVRVTPSVRQPEVPRACREVAEGHRAFHGRLSGTPSRLRQWNRAVGYFKAQSFYGAARYRAKCLIKSIVHELEAKCGIPLPYHISRRRHDEFARAIQNVMEKREISAVLVIGARSGAAVTELVLRNAEQNEKSPSIVCVSTSGGRAVSSQLSSSGDSLGAWWYYLLACSPAELSGELEKAVEQAKQQKGIRFFDALVIDGSKLGHQLTAGTLRKELCSAGMVIISGLNCIYNHDNYQALLKSPDYALANHNIAFRDGYAIFERESFGGERRGEVRL